MDLLKGYGSDDSSSSSSSSSSCAVNPTIAAKAHNDNAASTHQKSAPPITKSHPKKKKGGKRILSLGAVLPPEIFDRLTRATAAGGENDDSSTSSFEGLGATRNDGNDNGGGSQTKRERRNNLSFNDDGNSHNNEHDAGSGGAGDRTELNSLLNELRSTPLHVSTKKTSSKNGPSSLKKDDTSSRSDSSSNEKSGKLGMAFMSFTSSTTRTSKKSNGVVDIHAVKPKTVVRSKPQTASQGGVEQISKPVPPVTAMPSFSRMSTVAPVTSFARQHVPQYSQASSMPEYPAASQPYMKAEAPSGVATSSNMTEAASYNNNNTMPKSRKQRREEERALRSGQAFHNSATTATTELHQPSPTEFAPTAHAAAIASKAARYHAVAAGGGGGGNIAMYDPSSGTDVKGLGVTGKHRSKHQINQLMASAMSLEAHRASDAELARFGAGGGGAAGGKGGSRADAKRKYGW